MFDAHAHSLVRCVSCACRVGRRKGEKIKPVGGTDQKLRFDQSAEQKLRFVQRGRRVLKTRDVENERWGSGGLTLPQNIYYSSVVVLETRRVSASVSTNPIRAWLARAFDQPYQGMVDRKTRVMSGESHRPRGRLHRPRWEQAFRVDQPYQGMVGAGLRPTLSGHGRSQNPSNVG